MAPNCIKAPVVPFSARLAKAKLEAKYGKSLETMKQLHITIPFVHAKQWQILSRA